MLACAVLWRFQKPIHADLQMMNATHLTLSRKSCQGQENYSVYLKTQINSVIRAGSCFSIPFVIVNGWCYAQLNSHRSGGITRATKQGTDTSLVWLIVCKWSESNECSHNFDPALINTSAYFLPTLTRSVKTQFRILQRILSPHRQRWIWILTNFQTPPI